MLRLHNIICKHLCLIIDKFTIVRHVNIEQTKVGKVKAELKCGRVFVMQTTRFGPCTGPSSGLTCVGGSIQCVLQAKWLIATSRRSRCFAVQSC